ncbi:amidohydrolase [Bremerella alba]|uniref:N-substituted formamide deformylase n=1 Tax=Bremerella alba TaxID=980252 RepID=A0A7V8V0U5_9BACT|nr:amidohydrolase [Bremerella alba]MBA2112872.1 N-substituted formamide deformylase [Bremerella alba]
MSFVKYTTLAFFWLVLYSTSTISWAQEIADAIYFNGTVITLDEDDDVAQAMAIRGNKILAVGTNEEIQKLSAATTEMHDLQHKAILPGLYAAHDHFPGSGRVGITLVDLSSPPIGKIQTIDELISVLKEQASQVPAGTWIRGRGYDDTLMKEQRHPTRNDLDKVSKVHPIWIGHTSGHLGVANSKALEIAKVTRDTKVSKGSHIRKNPETGDPNGVLEECGGLITRHIPRNSDENELAAVKAAVEQYVSQGVTTTVIAHGGTRSVSLLKRAIAEDILSFRIVTMTSGGPYAKARAEVLDLDSPLLKAGAIKLMQDGSIQGYTGYLREPYYRSGEHRGLPFRSREELTQKVKTLHRAGFQIATHGNGDAAIDDILYAYEQAQKEFPRTDARHRIEHAQMMREDQIEKMHELGVSPSYFVGHVYYWGDRHRDIFLGPERGSRISPLATTLQKSVPFTVHDDTPVTPVDPLQLVWVAANRETSGGKVLGSQESIPVSAALRAVTIDAAWQNFEEDIKGSLVPGKLADFVIVDQDPLSLEPQQIRDVRVLQTVVGGKTVYSATTATTP